MIATPSPLTHRLPVVHHQGARLARLCFNDCLGDVLAADGTSLEVSQVHEVPIAPLHHLRLSSDVGDLEVLACAKDLPGLQMLSGSGTEADRFLALAAQAVFGPWLEQLARWGFDNAQVVGVKSLKNPAPTAAAAWCSMRDPAGREFRFTVTRWADEAHRAARRRLRGAAARHEPPRWLAAPTSVTLTTRSLSLATLQSLGSGDVVILPKAAASQDSAVEVHWGWHRGRRLGAVARLGKTTITIAGEAGMSEPKETPIGHPASEPMDNLGQLDIPIQFEIETVAVPLSELQSIRPGYVIEMSTPVETAAIRLVAYGKVVGHAQLVAVGDRLGARITRMVASDDQHAVA
jgi:type III secretion protein Q